MQQDDQHRTQRSSEDALQKSIHSLSRSLTVVVACTQLLQRQLPEGVRPETAESRIAMIEAATTDMIATLRHLENMSSNHT